MIHGAHGSRTKVVLGCQCKVVLGEMCLFKEFQPGNWNLRSKDRFARHDGALQELRNHTDKELEAIKESISKIEKQAETHATRMQANADQTNAEFKSLRSETANQMQAMSTMFAESLKSTLASQEPQLSLQFAELKEMIKTRAGGATGSSPPQEKNKDERPR